MGTSLEFDRQRLRLLPSSEGRGNHDQAPLHTVPYSPPNEPRRPQDTPNGHDRTSKERTPRWESQLGIGRLSFRKEGEGEKHERATPSRSKELRKESPLAWRMRELLIPESLREFWSSLMFNGMGNPNHHVVRFTTIMRLRGAHASAYCQAFAHTLEGSAREWFECLRPNSIYSWRQLSTFVTSFTFPLNPSKVLGAVRQGRNETIREYLGRFEKEIFRFEDLEEDQIMFWVKEGLWRGCPFHVAVSIEKPRTLGAFHEMSQDFEEGSTREEDSKAN